MGGRDGRWSGLRGYWCECVGGLLWSLADWLAGRGLRVLVGAGVIDTGAALRLDIGCVRDGVWLWLVERF